jgi:superoxide dismutase, Cu-Zn family
MRSNRFVLLAMCSVAVGSFSSAPVRADHIKRAKATIFTCDTERFAGTASLVENPSAEGIKVVNVSMSLRGLTAGSHAVHIHEIGACTPCSAAGSHLDLGPFGHNNPVTANHPYHTGDLINIRIGSDGRGSMSTATSRIALSAGNLSILDANGSSFIIHALPDTYCPDPADPNCAGGARVACGVIVPD